MEKQSNRRRWTTNELQKMKEFIISNRTIILSNFYKNIKAGFIKFRKLSGYFIQMSRIVDRSQQRCKSKFQKMEQKIYIDYLKVPKEHYELFLWIRKRKGPLPEYNLKSDFSVNSSDSSFSREKSSRKKTGQSANEVNLEKNEENGKKVEVCLELKSQGVKEGTFKIQKINKEVKKTKKKFKKREFRFLMIRKKILEEVNDDLNEYLNSTNFALKNNLESHMLGLEKENKILSYDKKKQKAQSEKSTWQEKENPSNENSDSLDNHFININPKLKQKSEQGKNPKKEEQIKNKLVVQSNIQGPAIDMKYYVPNYQASLNMPVPPMYYPGANIPQSWYPSIPMYAQSNPYAIPNPNICRIQKSVPYNPLAVQSGATNPYQIKPMFIPSNQYIFENKAYPNVGKLPGQIPRPYKNSLSFERHQNILPEDFHLGKRASMYQQPNESFKNKSVEIHKSKDELPLVRPKAVPKENKANVLPNKYPLLQNIQNQTILQKNLLLNRKNDLEIIKKFRLSSASGTNSDDRMANQINENRQSFSMFNKEEFVANLIDEINYTSKSSRSNDEFREKIRNYLEVVCQNLSLPFSE